MRPVARRSLEGVLGLVGVTLAVVWLSGGCEEKVAPVAADVPGAAAEGAGTATVEEVTEPAVEWASGEVAAARHTAVASRVLARIEEIDVRAGSVVSEGDVLVTLDARDLRARRGEAEEALRSAEARLELARQEHARATELLRTGVAPQRRLDEAISELRAAEADVAGRKQALAEADTAESFAQIRSPVSGSVIDRLAEPGDTAVPGRPLLRIYDPSLLRVEAPVRESLAVRLGVGDTLPVDVPALGEPVEGRIDEIVPFAERGARTLLVKVTLPRTDARLFAGMYARVAIPAGERRRLLVPEEAITHVGQLEFATVVGPDGAAERRAVTTGEREPDGRVEVLSGLDAGERVQLGGS
jgi:RND family efflux transporter MFP subunit